MNTATLPATISVGSTFIHQTNGLYSLNDLHQASGGDAKHQPSNFVRLDTTQALIAEISNSSHLRNYPPTETVRGKYGGTYACRELVIAYAAWISAEFHLKVIRVFLDRLAPAQAEPLHAPRPADLPPPVRTRTLTFTVPDGDPPQRWLLHTDRHGREIVTPLAATALLLTPEEILHLLAHNPADLRLDYAQQLTVIGTCLRSLHSAAAGAAQRLGLLPAVSTPSRRRST